MFHAERKHDQRELFILARSRPSRAGTTDVQLQPSRVGHLFPCVRDELAVVVHGDGPPRLAARRRPTRHDLAAFDADALCDRGALSGSESFGLPAGIERGTIRCGVIDGSELQSWRPESARVVAGITRWCFSILTLLTGDFRGRYLATPVFIQR